MMKASGLGKMAKLVKCLPCKQKDLGSDPRHPCRIMWSEHSGGGDRRLPVTCWPGTSGWSVSSEFSERVHEGRKMPDVKLWLSLTCTYTHTHLHIYVCTHTESVRVEHSLKPEAPVLYSED